MSRDTQRKALERQRAAWGGAFPSRQLPEILADLAIPLYAYAESYGIDLEEQVRARLGLGAPPPPPPAPAPPPPVSDKTGILVPAYFSPSYTAGAAFWAQLAAAAPRVPLIVIANPASGPGSVRQDAYTRVIKDVRAAGGKVVGYVATGYGAKATSIVQNDILTWQSLYGVTHIFLDELSTSALPYYAQIRLYIPGSCIGNPGTVAPSSYFDVFDIIVEAEGTEFKNISTAAGLRTKQAELVYNVSQDAALSFARNARTLGAGWIYATSDILSNPWDTLPPYWDAFVAEVARVG